MTDDEIIQERKMLETEHKALTTVIDALLRVPTSAGRERVLAAAGEFFPKPPKGLVG